MLTLSSLWCCCVGSFMDLCPPDEVLVSLLPLHQGSAPGAVRGVLGDFRLPDCTGSNPLVGPWCLAVNGVSQSWHYTLMFLPWITDVVMELISKTLNTSSGLCQAFFCFVQTLGCCSPGWSCSAAGLHSGRTPVLVSEALPGHGAGRALHCLRCHAVQHHLVSHLLL